MANPARVPDPRHTDPLNPVPPAESDPFTPDARKPTDTSDANVINRVEGRSGGSSVLIAAIVLVLAVIAYFVFAPGTGNTPAPGEQPATTTTEPATPAPDATAPATPTTPAPDATAPAAPADPAAPAPDAAAPAPAEPAPAPAPAPAEPAPAQ
jgi:hypothetical protein